MANDYSSNSEREAKVVLTAQTTEYNRKIEESQKLTDKFNKSLEKVSQTSENIVKKTSKGLFKIGAAEIAGITALSAVAATLEKQTSNIQANLALNKSSSQFNAVTNAIREMSRTIPMARAEIAGMATEVSNLGFVSSDQTSRVTKQFSKMGIATGEDARALAASTVQFQRAMGVAPSAETMKPVSESATLLSAQAGVSANDILSFAGSISPAARVAGLNQASVLGLSTAASRAGVDGMYASSTIQQILNDITMMRYTKSPEMRRYSSALGIPLEELLGPVESTDKFNRNIISKIIEASQSSEGPSRLSLLGFDGLRAKRALQGLASEPGGVEQWIQRAQYGMGTESVQTGFEAAGTGLSDQMTMLRNRATDVGQQLGEPTMEALTVMAKGANAFAEAIQPLTNLITTITGKIGPLVGTVTMLGGAMYAAWKTFSTISLIRRGAVNTTTSALASGFLEGQRIGRGEDTSVPINAMSARVQGLDPRGRQASGWQSTLYGIGSGLGTAVPGVRRPHPMQSLLMRTRQMAEGISYGTEDWYRKAAMTPNERYDLRMRQQEIDRIITPEHGARLMNRDELKQRAENFERFKRWQQTAATRGATRYPGMEGAVTGPIEIPEGMRVFNPAERETVTGVGRAVGSGYVRTPWAATKYAFREAGGALPFLRQAGAAAINDFGTGMGGSALGALGRGVSTIVSPQMLAVGATMYGLDTYQKNRDYTKRWEEGGQGFDGEVTNNLTKYNEKLGIATQSLQRFATALDETNPARSEDVGKELANEENTFYVGRGADYKMTDERIKSFGGSVKAAEEYLSQFGQLNADQAVTIFRDLGAIFNKSEWTQIRDWYLANTTNGTIRPDTEAGFSAAATSITDATSENRNIWQKAATAFGPLSGILGFAQGATNFDFLRMRNDKSGQIATDYISAAMARGKAVADTKAAPEQITGVASDLDKATALRTTVQFGKVAEALDELNKAYVNKSPGDVAGKGVARTTFMEAKDRAGEFLGVNLSGINPGKNAGEDIRKKMYEQIVEQSKNDQTLKAALDSGLIGKNFESFGGKSLNDFIGDLDQRKVTTTLDTMINSSKFKDMSETERGRWFGGTSVLAGMSVGISDPMKQLAASMKMLTLAQEKFGGSVQETDMALQSFKSNMSQNDVNWGIITGAQQLNELMYGQYETAGGGPQGWSKSFQRRSQFEQELATSQNPPTDTQERLVNIWQEGSQKIIEWYLKTREYEKSTFRQSEDFYRQMEWAGEDYIQQVEYAQDDHHRQMTRSKDAFHRQMVHSEAAYHRQLKYQQQDFYRSRRREQEAHDRQMVYMAEDVAKQIGDPYNRIQLQLLSDPAALIQNMSNRADIAGIMTNDISTLRNRGLSEQAMQQLNMFDFNNSQQTHHLANTITDADIAKFNDLAKSMVGLGGQIGGEDTGTKRTEAERQISLQQGLDDFLRNLKRTKIEHEIQIKFSKKEFKIGVAQAEEDYEIAMDRAGKAFSKAQDRSMEQFQKSMQRQADDLTEYFDTYAMTQEDMVKETKKVLGSVTSKGTASIIEMIDTADTEIRALKKLIDSLGDSVNDAMKKVSIKKLEALMDLEFATDTFATAMEAANKAAAKSGAQAGATGYYGRPVNGYGGGSGRGASVGGGVYLGATGGARASRGVRSAVSDRTNEPGMCLSQVSKWYGDAPSGVGSALAAWSKSKQKHPGDKHPPAGVPVYWGGGLYGHVALSIGAGLVRSTDWPRSGQVGTTSISQLSASWNKPYLGWTGDTWGKKLAEGGVVKAKNGGVNVTVAEAGADEAVIPIDRRGVEFMAMFAKAVAQQLVMSMPKTPASNTASHVSYDHSTNMQIGQVTVETQDPKRFMRELKMEASKKRAALYKSSFSGVETT